MPPRSPLEALSPKGVSDSTITELCGSSLEIPALNALALRSLVSLFDEKERLFSRSVTLGQDGFHLEGASPKRTIIALLGLHRLAESGETTPFDFLSMHDAILADTSWVRSLGDLGLLTWFTADCEPDRLRNLFNEFDFGSALDNYSDGREAQTRGLSWFLAGIAHAWLACPQTLPDLTDVAVDAYHLLQDNQSESGIFGHAALAGFLERTFCNRFGTFADQIYAIYALTTFARAFQIEEPLSSALSCGNSMRALQGEKGQWWFLYDKRACRVVSRYPVLTFHQDGTAPVGLLALGEATGQSFYEPVCKGLSWIAGANELGQDLRTLDRTLIWDSIAPRRRALKYWEVALGFMNISHPPRVESLRIQYAIRPDHFGWLLYAFGRCGLPRVAVTAKTGVAG
jgi:hypothetical protein